MARQEKKYHYIYKTTCLITGRYYIGMHSTDNLDDGYIGSGKRLWFSINYHGKENHVKEILEFLPTREELKKREKEIVTSEMIKEDLCMNLCVGGEGGYISHDGVKKGRQKCNDKLKEKYGDNYLSKMMKEYISNLTEEEKIAHGKKISDGRKKSDFDFGSIFRNKKHSDETKLIMREKKIGIYDGKNHPQYGTCWITKDYKNKKIKKEELYNYLSQGWIKGRFSNSSINQETLNEIIKLRKSGLLFKDISKIFNIPISTIIDNLKRNSKK